VQAQTHTPTAIFGNHIRYVVPMFQRPYVWTMDDQWRPLWEDVRAVAERLLEASATGFGQPPVPPHFLGAIVLDQQMIPSGFIATRSVIDGQQRLTTLQLLLDAAQLVVQRHGAPMDAQALRVLVLNDPAIAQDPDEVFKVWPTDRDQDAFRAAMDDAATVPAHLSDARIAQAHAFFVTEITAWAEVDGDPHKATARLNALVRTLRDHLKLVVIDLEPGDNAQVIFETLNHRGVPLLAADLVKNLVFQVAQAQGCDIHDLYARYWKPFDSDSWQQLVAQGRLYRPRVDVFLNHWLTMKLLREVPADRIFSEFRDYATTSGATVPSLLAELASDAAVYERMDSLPPTSPAGRFHYRVIRSLNSGVVSPFLLWILRWTPERMPAEQQRKALLSLESWMIRRALTWATSKDINRMILELLKELDRSGPEAAGDTVERTLAGQRADSRYWPGDEALLKALREEPLYKSLTRQRLRMILEALEDSLRTNFGEGQTCPLNLTVEHVMPQAWREHWDDGLDTVAALKRDRIVHSLGNLTLVTGRLNPALSNRPWSDDQANGSGKRDYLLRHSELKLNATLVADHDYWSEDDIAARTEHLARRIAAIWPCPHGTPQSIHKERRRDLAVPGTDVVTSAETSAEMSDEPEEDQDGPSHTGKYRALWQWLRAQDTDTIELSFAQVEQILQIPLLPSARTQLPAWYGYRGTALGRAIRDAGWKASLVSLEDERVTFRRQDPDAGAGPSSAIPAEDQPESAEDVDQVQLQRAFHDAMVNVYRRARTEAGYNATLFLTMVSQHGGLKAARTLLNAARPSEGFTALWERKRLDLSVEAVILEPRFQPLFTDEERQRARDRLARYEYPA
jgi:hypothetical protein